MASEKDCVQLRSFSEKFYLIDKIRKDVYQISETLFLQCLRHGVQSAIEDIEELSKLAVYFQKSTTQRQLGSLRNYRYSAIEDTFYDVVAPLFCTLEVTNVCNLSCSHCYHGENLNDQDLTADCLTLAEYEQLFEQLSVLGTLVIAFTGGEAFMRKDFPEILKLASKHDFLIQVFTNAVLFDEEKQDLCDKLGVDKVQISLYTEDMQTNPSHTRQLTKARENLTKCLNRDFCLVGTLTPTFENLDFVEQVSDELKEMGVPFSYNVQIHPTQNGNTSSCNRSVMNDTKVMESLCEFENFGLIPIRDDLSSKPCNAGHNVFSINYNGNFTPCIIWPEAIGNIKSSSPIEIFQCDRFDEIRATRISDFSKCAACSNATLCGLCPGSNYAKNLDNKITNTDICGYTEARKLI
jgi:radical SAM protein with 4Fe4S-binding SPASM domain